jgi:hypothetical protein
LTSRQLRVGVDPAAPNAAERRRIRRVADRDAHRAELGGDQRERLLRPGRDQHVVRLDLEPTRHESGRHPCANLLVSPGQTYCSAASDFATSPSTAESAVWGNS